MLVTGTCFEIEEEVRVLFQNDALVHIDHFVVVKQDPLVLNPSKVDVVAQINSPLSLVRFIFQKWKKSIKNLRNERS